MNEMILVEDAPKPGRHHSQAIVAGQGPLDVQTGAERADRNEASSSALDLNDWLASTSGSATAPTIRNPPCRSNYAAAPRVALLKER